MKNNLINRVFKISLITGLVGLAGAMSGCASYDIAFGDSTNDEVGLKRSYDRGSIELFRIEKNKKDKEEKKTDYYFKNW